MITYTSLYFKFLRIATELSVQTTLTQMMNEGDICTLQILQSVIFRDVCYAYSLKHQHETIICRLQLSGWRI